MTADELRASIFHRLEICNTAEQATIDDPDNPDRVQSRAANVQKQLGLIHEELEQLLGLLP